MKVEFADVSGVENNGAIHMPRTHSMSSLDVDRPDRPKWVHGLTHEFGPLAGAFAS
jgi:hypothetical protein